MAKVFEYGIIGMGPAGIGVATSLTKQGFAADTVCFEQGQKEATQICLSADTGICCNRDSCLVVSGIGGASNFSSGKISDYPAGSGLSFFFRSDDELRTALFRTIQLLNKSVSLKITNISNEQRQQAKQSFEEKGLEYKYYDVYEFQGKEYQEFIAKNVYDMEQKGLTVLQNARVLKIEEDSINHFFLVRYSFDNREEYVPVRKLAVATGALNIHDHLISEVENAERSCFEVGLRVEAPSEVFGNAFTTHGDLKLKYLNGRTYCVTENGAVITYKSDGRLFLEGCKLLNKRTDFSNFAVLIKRTDNKELDSILSNYRSAFDDHPIKQMYFNYLNGEQNYNSTYTTCKAARDGDINSLFPKTVNLELKDFLNRVITALGLPVDNLTIIAPELKMLRSVDLSSRFEVKNNLFVTGAATGKFRGILQSLCSGIKCGQEMARR